VRAVRNCLRFVGRHGRHFSMQITQVVGEVLP